MSLRICLICALSWLASCQAQPGAGLNSPATPNILLVVFEDMSQKIGAFGDPIATTPILDAFAEESILYPNTFTTAGVCAPSRAALITGVHQQSLGAQHMRTHAFGTTHEPSGYEIGYTAVPPPEVKAFPELMRQAGYYTFTGYGGWVISNKKDYQFGTPFTIWDDDSVEASWRGRASGQPFFGMVTLATTHESFLFPEQAVRTTDLAVKTAARNSKLLAGKEKLTRPADVIVPPWLPDTPEVRQEIAAQYDNIAFTEKKLQVLLSDLEADGLADNTIVIVTTDHGDGFPRAKRSLYDSGIRVPLMIRLPGGEHAGEVRDELVSFVDLAPTILSTADTSVPAWIQGRDFLGSDRDFPNQYVFASSDRMDSAMDRMKAVRDERYKLIRNYRPEVPLLPRIAFREELRSMQAFRALSATNGLSRLQNSYFDTPRPTVEMYDTLGDPEETRNLAGEERLSAVQNRLAGALDDWLLRTPDWSAVTEREMVEMMWPAGHQPVTLAPNLRIEKMSDQAVNITLSSPTEGASLAWRYEGESDTEWRVYTGGTRIPAIACIDVKAVRYGYEASVNASKCMYSDEVLLPSGTHEVDE
ncbi:sulfatase [Hyphomonas oceanitis SCH89]|uniref:Sulfatase n=2 Tax=Hyphomonas oceanitis TaxID=81033 RepID=A0A059G3T9_9PROT|nr:sulfatase [Hyphomonas oceanitis]KDA01517.1 sulfatase [Hyphomonas oceanitis SCH89]